MTQPTGVFVRLPLSEAARELLVDAAAYGQPDDSHDKAILSTGTPVTGGDASVVDYSEYEPKYHDQGMGCGLEDRSIHDRYEAMGYGWDQAMERVCSEFPETVLLPDHQAALAAAQAEIVRLLGVIRAVDGLIMGNNDPIKMFVAIHSACQSALKGPEA
ncbi:hypothetical protein [Acetobacter malorum]|uniref:hypothetical protein n=1 Tax=Acetobacter malorum TaxID=178901 RepID=UPI0039E90E41